MSYLMATIILTLQNLQFDNSATSCRLLSLEMERTNAFGSFHVIKEGVNKEVCECFAAVSIYSHVVFD